MTQKQIDVLKEAIMIIAAEVGYSNRINLMFEKAFQPQLNKPDVSGWQDFPEQKPTEGQLIVMGFDDTMFFTNYYTLGLEENFRPFKKMRFIPLPALH